MGYAILAIMSGTVKEHTQVITYLLFNSVGCTYLLAQLPGWAKKCLLLGGEGEDIKCSDVFNHENLF